MSVVIIAIFAFFLLPHPLGQVSHLSKKQNARNHEKTEINKVCAQKFVYSQKNMNRPSANHNIDDFSTCSTKKNHKRTKNKKNGRDAPQNVKK